ncbi:gas vesicle protein K [Prolixibacteraceae bacterium JC049]|nr:gas vesicle protein K [Prolixibacteraceae bacterium JC049]
MSDKLLLNTGSNAGTTHNIEEVKKYSQNRLNATSENADSALIQLVLTLVELIRRLVEKQAIRRVEGGTLCPDEIEHLGTVLMKLEDKMEELKQHFDLTDEDLNINLGPLGDLM